MFLQCLRWRTEENVPVLQEEHLKEGLSWSRHEPSWGDHVGITLGHSMLEVYSTNENIISENTRMSCSLNTLKSVL